MYRTSLIILFLVATFALTAPRSDAADVPPWADAMKAVHSRYSGRKGTFAQFGDSITLTDAFWSSLLWEKRKMNGETQSAYDAVKAYMQPECWRGKGPQFGNDSGKTAAWADENVNQWLKDIDPEVAVIMFGTNDLMQTPIDQYESKMRSVIQKCFKNGTIVILTTIPPRHDKLEESRRFAEVDRKLATELKLPLIDFFNEIVKRRPDDWDGADPKMKNIDTITSWDGIHPSYPQKYQGDYTEEGLKNCGYGLRTYLTLLEYRRVIESVLK